METIIAIVYYGYMGIYWKGNGNYYNGNVLQEETLCLACYNVVLQRVNGP